MNLAKALKTKSRIAQKIAELQNDIQNHNSAPSSQERKIDVSKLMKDLETSVHNITRLKILIFETSSPMRETILTLAETKSRISFLRGIDTSEGKNQDSDYGRRGYSDPEVEFSVEFDIVWIRTEVEKCEEKIDKLQEELDIFNHKTIIEF
jgi:hypothetical protein